MKILEDLMTQLAQIRDGQAKPGRGAGAPEVKAALLAEIQWKTSDYSVNGYHFDLSVPPQLVLDAARLMDEKGFTIDAVTGVDWLAEKQFEVIYDFFHFHSQVRVVVRSRIPRDNPEIPSIASIYPGANWHERETRDFFGIHFANHPNLIPILLPEDADYHPLRKDFSYRPEHNHEAELVRPELRPSVTPANEGASAATPTAAS